VAKVVRDRMMALLAARYPGYGWERNQGYATKEHRDAIRQLGLTPYHRRSFLALQRTLAGDQISLDLFDEAVASVEEEAGARELDRLDGIAVARPADDAVSSYPAYYMINCAHPAHFAASLDQTASWTSRIRGVRANASRCSHAELDAMTELDIGDITEPAALHHELTTANGTRAVSVEQEVAELRAAEEAGDVTTAPVVRHRRRAVLASQCVPARPPAIRPRPRGPGILGGGTNRTC